MNDPMPTVTADEDALLARAFAGEPEAAVAALDALAQRVPSASVLSSLGIANALAGRWPDAIRALHRAQAVAPGDVLAQAYLGAVLHHAGDRDAAARVLAHEDMVIQTELWPGAPAAQVAGFNGRLLAHAAAHPTRAWQRAGKATRGGWQTDELLDDRAPVTDELQAALRQRLQALFGEAEDEPLPWRLTAWAVGLASGGYQQPHVHRAGILSGVLYLQVPAMTGPADAGCLRFTRRLPWLPLRDADAGMPYVVRPAPGRLVIFPSYFWHDTVPFESAAERVSIAFDVLPPLLP